MPNNYLSIDQIISKIKKKEIFEATAKDGSFYIRIDEYVPYVCAAIHNGNKLRSDLSHITHLSEKERWYEEDPNTADFITSFPIVIEANDSRFEYDLNRSPDDAIYTEAWGKKVWKKELMDAQKEASIRKHKNFYKVIDALVKKIEGEFSGCIVYDIHSYNYKRYTEEYPVFNLGIENIDSKKYTRIIQHFTKELSKIELPNLETTVGINQLFYGRGHFLKHITNKFKRTLVLATEVKKVYCDEETGELFPIVIDAIKEGFKKGILNNALLFTKNFTSLKVRNKNVLLSSELDPHILKVDKQLYNLTRNFELLYFVNPINIEQEKKKFFQSKYRYEPEFVYRQLIINPFELKRKLNHLPVEKIDDVNIQYLYEQAINAFTDKIEMLASIGTPKFYYNSLRYFGEPTKKDIDNARFIMFCEPYEESEPFSINTQQAVDEFRKTVKEYGFECKIALTDKIISRILVLNNKKTLYIHKNAQFTSSSLKALTQHEIGVHMVTTMNSLEQPLKIFHLGLPVFTQTQEGIAVLAEYYSGSMTLKRLKELALRVIAINSLGIENSFSKTFALLKEEYKLDDQAAFTITSRTYRGGGFTKDFLYLRGLISMLKYKETGKSINNLLIGKTSLEYIDTINEMVERGLLKKPKYITASFKQEDNNNKTLKYIISCLK